ncbi:MAG: hypothetical protein K5989_12570 [Lachnospiraceae bacterium]|nr:hypothetical protein [Lachnospiraceae bacterium]
MDSRQFEEALKGKKIPVLILDNRWHRLIKDVGQTKEIEGLVKELKELVQEQGKITTELKDMKKIKANLMDEIVSNMNGITDSSDKVAQKKLEDDKRLINEINERTEEYNDRMLDLPREIQEVNGKLMLLTMERSYSMIQDNTDGIEELGEWIQTTREELKKNILEKQRMELVNVELYTYMQGIFGPEVVNLFDIKYDIEAAKQAIIDRHEAIKEERARKEAEQVRKEAKEAQKEAHKENKDAN